MISASQMFVFVVFAIACAAMPGTYWVSRKHGAHAGGRLLEMSMWGSGLVVSVCLPELISFYLLHGI